MAGRTPFRGARGRPGAIVCAVLLAVAARLAGAAPCTAPSVESAASAAGEEGGKFSLIARQCPGLVAPAQVRRAAQLELAAQSAPLSFPMPALQSIDGSPQPTAQEAPLGRDAARIVALAPALMRVAHEHGIDPLLLHAVAHVESRHDPRAVSPAGARGLMQVMPATAKRFGVGDPAHALFDAETNLRAAAAYLRTLRIRFGDDLNLVLAAYNAGEGAVEKHGRAVPPFPETQAYVREVLAVYRRLGDAFAVSATGTLVARGVQP